MLRGPRWRTRPTAPPERPPSARRPGPRALTCSRSRILGAARPAQRPASRGPAARPPQPQPQPRPHRGALMGLACLTSCLQKLGPQTIPPGRGRRRPRRGEGPGDETGRRGAPHRRKRAGAGAAGRPTDGHGTRGRSHGAAGAGRPSPWAGRTDPGRRQRPVTSESWNAAGRARGRRGQLRPAAGEGARRFFF